MGPYRKWNTAEPHKEKNAVGNLLARPDEELISLVEGALTRKDILPSPLEEALARKLCEKIGKEFTV